MLNEFLLTEPMRQWKSASTGARILSQAVKQLSTIPSRRRAIASICADGRQGTVALLQAA